MSKHIKILANKIFSSFGYSIKKLNQSKEVIDLRNKEIHPLEAYYIAKGRSFILELPIEKINALGFSCANPNNPFVQTLLLNKNGGCTCYLDSPLRDFYESWQPGEVDKFKSGLPWENGLGENSDFRLQRLKLLKIQNKLGYQTKEVTGFIMYGPVSDAFGDITFNRFVNIFNSVQIKGYNSELFNSNHIQGRLFIGNDDYRVTVRNGKHRIAALLALNYKKIPILFNLTKTVIVRREDVVFWPNVQAGFYSLEEALKIFDKKFNIEHPSNWKLKKS